MAKQQSATAIGTTVRRAVFAAIAALGLFAAGCVADATESAPATSNATGESTAAIERVKLPGTRVGAPVASTGYTVAPTAALGAAIGNGAESSDPSETVGPGPHPWDPGDPPQTGPNGTSATATGPTPGGNSNTGTSTNGGAK
jgi:hypothetical protein